MSNQVHSSGLKEALGDHADYRAAKRQTKLRPKPRGIRAQGSSADWHFRKDSDHLWVGELGREYDRNTPVGTRMLNMLTQNVLQDQGFLYNPNTGDEKLDSELKSRVDELFNDERRIDLQGEYNFLELSKMVFRDELSAGDIFGVFNVDGPIELREFHLCRQPYNRGTRHKNNVLGVELTEERKRLGYWFTKEPVSPLDSYRIKQTDLEFVDAWDLSTDWPTRNVLHIRDARRITQTRGVSFFAPVFDYLGMFEDSQFQQLVKSQLSNMMLLVRERGPQFNKAFLSKRLASGIESEQYGKVDTLVEELYPGAELQGLPDERIQPWTPNIPNMEWFDHMRLVLRIIGITWGMPYVLMMLDTADTNFHGYRGAIVEARETFRTIQRSFAKRWYSPVLIHYLHRIADEDTAIGRFRERSLREAKRRTRKVNLFGHSWTLPGWASVDDLKDAQSDLIRLGNSLTSHRKAAQSQDLEWEELSAHIIEDKSIHWRAGIEEAIEQIGDAMKLATKIGVKIDPKDIQLADIERWASRVAPLPWADRNNLTMVLDDQVKEPDPAPATSTKKPEPKQ